MTETTERIPRAAAEPRRLTRSQDNRWLGGVCAGLGRYFDLNPTVYRIAFAALTLAGGTGILLYAAAWLVIPDERAEDSIASTAIKQHRERPWLLIGVGLLAFGGILALSEARFWPSPGNLWLAAALAGAAIVWWQVSTHSSAARTAGRRRGAAAAGAGLPPLAVACGERAAHRRPRDRRPARRDGCGFRRLAGRARGGGDRPRPARRRRPHDRARRRLGRRARSRRPRGARAHAH